MKNKDESYKKIIESLWVEINRAILGSANIKTSLANLRELGLLKEVSEYNLVVDVNKMVEMMLDKPESNERPLKPQKSADAEDKRHRPDDSFEDFFSEDNITSSGLHEEPQAKKIPAEPGRNARQFIDGKPMSQNQIHFQEYLEQQFDMEAWLKKARIRF